MPTHVLVVTDESDLERPPVRQGADALAPVQSGGLVKGAGNFFRREHFGRRNVPLSVRRLRDI